MRHTLHKRWNLRAILAHRRWNPVDSQRCIHILFGCGGNGHRAVGDITVGIGLEQSVLVEAHSLPDRAFAQPNIVLLASGEIQQRGAEAVKRNNTKIDLHATLGKNARLGVALSEHARDLGARAEQLHQLCAIGRRCQNVDVADGLASATQAAGVGDLLHELQCGKLADQRLRQRHRFANTNAAACAFGKRNRLLHVLDGLWSHARKFGDGARFNGSLQRDEVDHASVDPQRARGLGADALNGKNLLQTCRNLRAQFLELRHGCGVAELDDLRRGGRADAFDFLQRRDIHLRGRRRQRFNRAGGFTKRVHLEHIGAENLGQDGEFLKRGCDFSVGGHSRNRVANASTTISHAKRASPEELQRCG